MDLKDQVALAIYQGYYEVVNVTPNLPQADFFNSTIASIWPNTPPPADWPTFWYDSVALEIQSQFMRLGMYLPTFNGAWIQNNPTKTWNDLLTMATVVTPTNPGLLPYLKSIKKN